MDMHDDNGINYLILDENGDLNMSMNYRKEGQKLPLFGVGPYLVWGIGLITLIGIILTYSILESGVVHGVFEAIF